MKEFVLVIFSKIYKSWIRISVDINPITNGNLRHQGAVPSTRERYSGERVTFFKSGKTDLPESKFEKLGEGVCDNGYSYH